MQEKLIITAALTGGGTTKANNPNIPYLPEEFAEESHRCFQEGVSIVHIHAKDYDTGEATLDVQIHRDIVAAIHERCPELIINISTGAVGCPAEDRIAPALAVKPELASYNTSTMNFAFANHKTGEIIREFIYENTFEMMVDFAQKMKAAHIKPECEIFDSNGIYNVILLMRRNLFAEPIHFQFVYGVVGGMHFDPSLHMALVRLLPENSTFSVCGVGPNQYQAAMMGALTGGHIRIGLEDNTKVPSGDLAKGSWEQAIWVRDIAKIAGRPIATPDEAKQILSL